MAQHLKGIATRHNTGNGVQHGKPDVVPEQHENDNFQEYGKLPREAAFVGKSGKGGGNKERQQGNDHVAHDLEHDRFQLVQQAHHDFSARPQRRYANKNSRYQGCHDRHDRGDIQLEEHIRQRMQGSHRRGNGQMGDDGVSGEARHGGRAY